MKPERGISRIDQPSTRTFGWYVRLNRSGKAHAKWFSDARNCGKRKARVAARAFRDEMFKANGVPTKWGKR